MDPDLMMLLGIAPAAAQSGAGGMAPQPVTGGAISNGPLYSPAVGQVGPAPVTAPTPAADATSKLEADAKAQPATDVDGITVTAKRPPKPVSQPLTPEQLDNSQSVGAAQDSLAKANLAAQGHPAGYAQGGSDNPGVFGMLPQGMQHGTLRNVIGALGDAFLVGSGRQAEYEPRMQRQSLGNAMAGLDVNDPDSVRAAATRMASSGVPGAADQAQKLFEQSAQLQIRKQIQEQNNQYRQSQVQSRQDTAIQRMTPYAGAILQGATSKEDYAARYARAEAMAQRISPDAHATDFGAPDPDSWEPGMTSSTGATTGQVMRQQTSEDSITERSDASQRRDVTTRRGQDMTSANSHYSTDHRNAPQMNSTGLLRSLMAIPAAQRTPEQQDYVTRNTQPSARGRGGRSIPPSAQVGGGQGGKMINGVVSPVGRAPTVGEVKMLAAHPEARAAFEQHFGQGSAAVYLGH